MSDSILLYRGDYEKIDEFDFDKTYRHCLVGQGIYLTNRKSVAESYCEKGGYGKLCSFMTLFNGEAKDRPDAYDKAFRVFCDAIDPLTYKQEKAMSVKDAEKRRLKFRAIYDDLIQEGVIVSEYICNHRTSRTIRVTYNAKAAKGWVSHFEFPYREFNDAMLNIDRVSDRDILGLFFDNQVKFGTPYATKDDYIRGNFGQHRAQLNRSDDFVKIRKVIEPFGFRGFEYHGGARVGGFGKHRAFCVWDDEWVNSHRVNCV